MGGVAACGPAEPAPYDEGLPDDPRLGQVRAFAREDFQRDPDEGAPEQPPPQEPPPAEPAPFEELPPPADCTKVRVTDTGGVTLNVRPDPSTAQAVVGVLDPGQVVDVVSLVPDGETVNGTATWYAIDAGSLEGFVSGAFTACIDANAPAPVDGFFLPLTCGRTTTITQGNNSAYSHNGRSRYAFDFSLPRGTPLVAVDDGEVIYARGATRPGDPCWSGGGQSCANQANYIVVEHPDGTASMYAHLNEPSLDVGDIVLRGEQVGLSGGTGWSTGPHAHVARFDLCGSPFCQTRQMVFEDVPGDGIPATGDSVTSQNCH